MLHRRSLLTATGVLTSLPDWAIAASIADAFTDAFKRWCATNLVEAGAIAVRQHGQLVASLGIGEQRVNEPAPVASLSKAITALCFSRLVEAGLTDYLSTIGTVLKDYRVRADLSHDLKIAEITFSQLLSQRSGLVAGVSLPTAANDMARNMRTPLEEQVRRVLSRPLIAPPGTRFIYGNSNYQILSLAIELLSAKDYAVCCHEYVFGPLGISNAYIGDSYLYAARSGAGGWFLSVEDFALIADQIALNSPKMGVKTREWLLARRTERPAYGLGSVSRAIGSNLHAISHNGTLKYSDVSASSAFVKWSNGWTVALNLRPNRNDVLNTLLMEMDGIALRILRLACS
jgi:CubicO group peptidase (beta-lactamase class C family)